VYAVLKPETSTTPES